jgi:hypothetical protein
MNTVIYKKPKKWTSAKVCPNCSSRATKILSVSKGCYICQICDHEYLPPSFKSDERSLYI